MTLYFILSEDLRDSISFINVFTYLMVSISILQWILFVNLGKSQFCMGTMSLVMWSGTVWAFIDWFSFVLIFLPGHPQLATVGDKILGWSKVSIPEQYVCFIHASLSWTSWKPRGSNAVGVESSQNQIWKEPWAPKCSIKLIHHH